MTADKVHFLKASLDEVAGERGSKQIVLRGVLDPASLPLLKVDDYQREPLPLSRLTRLWQALRDGESLPDIELALRGLDYENAGDEFWLANRVYIIDGQQRRNAALHILGVMPDLRVRLGAMVHFGTSREWERERFAILNLERVRVSPNVLLRNMRHENAAVLTLYGLTYNDPAFALYERVCWRQNVAVNELLTARTLLDVAAALHSHRSASARASISDLAAQVERQSALVKLDQWRQNILYFFDLIDDCFGLRKVTYRDLALQVRAGFVIQLALLISDHTNFWRGERNNEMMADADMRKRLAAFPLHDPAVAQFVAMGSKVRSGGASPVYSMLRDHLNKGRSMGRLRSREEDRREREPRTFGSEPIREGVKLEYPRA